MKKLGVLIFFVLVICVAAGCSNSMPEQKPSVAAVVEVPVLSGPVTLPATADPSPELTEEETAKRIPVKIELPSLDISAQIQPVGLDNEGRVDTIPDALEIGWYKYGATPGAQGNAILVGHRDWQGQLGSFRNIERLNPADTAKIEFEDGSSKSFKVTSNNTYPLDQVPANVMQLKGESRITLITCAGKFIKEKGGYQSRVIVILQ